MGYRYYGLDPVSPTRYDVTLRSGTSIITLDELKQHLFIFDTDNDAYLTRLLIVGTELAENQIGEFLTPNQVTAYWPDFRFPLRLEHRYTDRVVSVSYVDALGGISVVGTDVWIFDNTGYFPVVRSRTGQAFPSDLSQDVENPVSITYEATLDDQNVTETAKQAVMLYCAAFWQNRESYLSTGAVPQALPIAAERLLSNFKQVSN